MIIDFLEKHLPNYYSRDDVAELDDLARWLSKEMDNEEKVKLDLFNCTYSEVFEMYLNLQDSLFEEALKAKNNE